MLIQYQQERSKWTKAKKKRQARYERRQRMAEKGIPLPRPSYYIPVDTPVVNAVEREEQEREIARHDKAVSEEMQQKMQALKELRDERGSMLRFHMSDGVKMSDRVKKLFDLRNGNQKEVVQVQKQQGMELFQRRPGDTGSTPVQIIALTTRIQQLQMHFMKHRKDKHSKRGMDMLYVRRRKLLDYLERKDFDAYRKVVKTLGLARG